MCMCITSTTCGFNVFFVSPQRVVLWVIPLTNKASHREPVQGTELFQLKSSAPQTPLRIEMHMNMAVVQQQSEAYNFYYRSFICWESHTPVLYEWWSRSLKFYNFLPLGNKYNFSNSYFYFMSTARFNSALSNSTIFQPKPGNKYLETQMLNNRSIYEKKKRFYIHI